MVNVAFMFNSVRTRPCIVDSPTLMLFLTSGTYNELMEQNCQIVHVYLAVSVRYPATQSLLGSRYSLTTCPSACEVFNTMHVYLYSNTSGTISNEIVTENESFTVLI